MRVLASGVRRVVIGALDPIDGHGGGAVEIAAAGIDDTTAVRTDDPRLTVRDLADTERAPRDPVRIVVDSLLRTPPTAAMLQGSPARTIIACTSAASAEREQALTAAGAEVWRVIASRDDG